MAKQTNGWTRVVAAVIGLTMIIATGVSAHWLAVGRIGACESAIIRAHSKLEDQACRLRYMEFILVRLADKQGVDVSGFK